MNKKLGEYYTVQRLLGQGAFGKVYLCDLNGQQLAVKVLDKSKYGNNAIQYAFDEAQILQQLQHKNIVKCYGYKEIENLLLIEMEYLRGGNLENIIRTKTFTDEEASIIIKQLLQALDYIHSKNIVHRDLKPNNIMFALDSISSLKLLDFGLSALNNVQGEMDDTVGTVIYMAPELAGHRNYTKQVDLWSCGLIQYKILTGRHPLYENETDSEYFRKINSIDINYEFPESMSQMARDFFQKLTHTKPTLRYTASQALNHPWITREKAGKIPLNYMQQFQLIQDQEKWKNIAWGMLFLGGVASNLGLLLEDEYDLFLEDPSYQKVSSARSSKKKLKQKEKIQGMKSQHLYGNRLDVPMEPQLQISRPSTARSGRVFSSSPRTPWKRVPRGPHSRSPTYLKF